MNSHTVFFFTGEACENFEFTYFLSAIAEQVGQVTFTPNPRH